jgi:hypothetical protein
MKSHEETRRSQRQAKFPMVEAAPPPTASYFGFGHAPAMNIFEETSGGGICASKQKFLPVTSFKRPIVLHPKKLLL